MKHQNPIFIPGPSNTPDVLKTAMNISNFDHRAPDFADDYLPLLEDLKKVINATPPSKSRLRTATIPSRDRDARHTLPCPVTFHGPCSTSGTPVNKPGARPNTSPTRPLQYPTEPPQIHNLLIRPIMTPRSRSLDTINTFK